MKFQSEEEMIMWMLAVNSCNPYQFIGDNIIKYADSMVEEFRKRIPGVKYTNDDQS
jgi:hypothetical protein